MYQKILLLLYCFVTPVVVMAQSADDLFTQARNAAFQEKNYPKAISLSQQALIQKPQYAEIRVFLGRIYTWNKQLDSARINFRTVIKDKPDYADAYLALGNLEFWNDDNKTALQVVDAGLNLAPREEDLLLLKAKILNNEKEWLLADDVVTKLLKVNPTNTEARSLSMRIKDNSAKNKIGVNYDFVYFDKQFDDPWHLVSVDYSRQTKLGSIAGRVNYANRFKSNGTQFEIDAYPRISSLFYAYVNFGYAPEAGVFPQYRSGASLYANLPKSFEADFGVRFLRFSDNVFVYTASVGKYYKNFWFNVRTYVTPSNDAVSQSFALTTRYYFGGAEDYLSLVVGTGISPDDQQNNVLINTDRYKLKSNNVSIGYRKSFQKINVFSIKVGFENQEYLRGTTGNQLDIGLGYVRRF